jgi:hypothetical protein
MKKPMTPRRSIVGAALTADEADRLHAFAEAHDTSVSRIIRRALIASGALGQVESKHA